MWYLLVEILETAAKEAAEPDGGGIGKLFDPLLILRNHLYSYADVVRYIPLGLVRLAPEKHQIITNSAFSHLYHLNSHLLLTKPSNLCYTLTAVYLWFTCALIIL
jgi:hypothetical protein